MNDVNNNNEANLSTTSWFWHEHFWLPENVTWDNLRSKNGMQYPQFRELGYTLLLGLLITFIRICIESLVFVPIGYLSGWMDSKKVSLIQRVWSHFFFGFAGRTKFKRVAETAWRFTYYLCIWIIGFYILYDEPQFGYVIESFRDWPNHHVPNDVWWYYIVQAGFYWALLIGIFTFDVRRSDHYEMATHHIATILLLSMSFTINFVRIGTLILFIHDSADVFLEMGKLFRYASWDTAVTIDFCVFMIVWVGTRLIYFPFKIVLCMLFDAPPLIQQSYRWENLLQRPIVPRVFMVMLCFLLILHLFWTYLLIKIAVKSIKSGVDDIREDDAEIEEDDALQKDKKVE